MSDAQITLRRAHHVFAWTACAIGLMLVAACARRRTVATFADGATETEVERHGLARDGHFVRYHDNGKKAVETHYRDGLRDGKWLVWYADGTPAQEGAFVSGLREGAWSEWNTRGKKVLAGTWHAGDKTGTWSEFDDDGVLVATELFEDGTRRARLAAHAH